MRIAVVDDDRTIIENLSKYILSICKEKDISVKVDTFSDGENLLENYNSEYDVIFLDIEMEHMDGMTAARKIRETDPDTILVFVTQMTQYAIEGYKVEALDYIVKPVEYYSFQMVFRKILRRLGQQTGKSIVLNIKGDRKVLRTSEIYYVEILDHYLTYHTMQGEVRVKGTLSEVQAQLDGCGFFKCNRYCLVNVRLISEVNKTDLVVQGQTLEMSRLKKRELLLMMAEYRGGVI